MENIIFNELKVRGYNFDVGVVVMNETDQAGKKIRKQLEIDFVCNKGSKRYYIQSAFAMHDEDWFATDIGDFQITITTSGHLSLIGFSRKIY